MTISSPQEEVRYLLRQANDLHDRARSSLKTVKGPVLPALGGVAVRSLVPHGLKGTARSFGRDIHRGAKADEDRKWREQGVLLASACVQTVGRMSVRRKNLSLSGNSKTLVAKFNRLTNIKTSLAYIRNLISILEGIEKLDLIWNADIDEELRHRAEEKERLKREERALKLEAKAIVEDAQRSRFSRKDPILKELGSYPRARQSMVSAFNRLQNPDPEAPRHVIVSCRAAIEQLCIDAGGTGDWKAGLRTVCSSETDVRQVKGVYQYLSGRGGHGGHDPTPREAERCLALTLTTLDLILDNTHK